MVVARRILVLSLLWTLAPGLTEATENVWHLLYAGHTAHAADQGPDHEPAGDEHGCSSTFHLCSCHPTPVSTAALRGGDDTALCTQGSRANGIGGWLPAGFPAGLDHPPQS